MTVLLDLANKIYNYNASLLQEPKQIVISPAPIPNQVFIMAHGKGSRWMRDSHNECPSVYKQLLPIDGVPIILRTYNQLHAIAENNMIVFAPHAFREVLPKSVEMLSVPMTGIDTILTGIVFTEFLWNHESNLVFLLGDVIFEFELLKRIMSKEDYQVTFFGRNGGNKYTGKPNKELFAMKVPFECRKDFCNEFLELAFDPQLFKLFHAQNKLRNSKTVYWNGWTGDIDSYQEYERYYNILVDYAKEDDKHAG